MLIKEYRIPMPMSVEEYRVAQLYMIQKKSREESHGEGSGVEILENKPYDDGSGQYTLKVYHIGKHIPSWFRAVLPQDALRVEEESWNAYPHTRTRYTCPFVDKFFIDMETFYEADTGSRVDVFNEQRDIDLIDIANDYISPDEYLAEEDPKLYRSEKTGRGPLSGDWIAEVRRERSAVMCAYKLCKVEFGYWGAQTKIERFIHDVGLRKVMVRAHRQAWCWQDEWFGLTVDDVRVLELETQLALAKKMAGKNEDEEEGGENIARDSDDEEFFDAQDFLDDLDDEQSENETTEPSEDFADADRQTSAMQPEIAGTSEVGEVSAFAPYEPREKWLHKRTRVKTRNTTANHRVNDSVFVEGGEQIVTGRFAYGPLDLVALTGEKIDIHIRTPVGVWLHFDTELTDASGRVSYAIPANKRLVVGVYLVKMVVRGDHSNADGSLIVVPEATQFVVFGIGGSLATGASVTGGDAKVRAGAADVARFWHDSGYPIVYVTRRPDSQKQRVSAWLCQHGFPRGVVSFLCDGVVRDPLRRKADFLKSLVNEASMKIFVAYGSAKDIPAYSSIGLPPSGIYVVGKPTMKTQNRCQFIADGYALHLSQLEKDRRSATTSTSVLRNASRDQCTPSRRKRAEEREVGVKDESANDSYFDI